MTAVTGMVQSHTIIRVPDKAHAGMAPFVLLLVALDDGTNTLGHFDLPMRNCTIALDGIVVVKDGVLQGELAL